MRIGLWGFVAICVLSIGGALDIGKGVNLLFRATIGAINGGTSAIMDNKQNPNIIINVPEQPDRDAGRGYRP